MKSLALQTKTKLLSLLLLCCALLLWLPGTASAEATYTVTETQLTQLMQDSATLSQDNKQLQENLETSTKDLEELRGRLESVKSQLSKYQSLSQTALQSSEETLKLLQETQKSLRKLRSPRIRLGVEGSVTSADNAENAEANLRISRQSEGLDIDIRVNQSKQSISATRWF